VSTLQQWIHYPLANDNDVAEPIVYIPLWLHDVEVVYYLSDTLFLPISDFPQREIAERDLLGRVVRFVQVENDESTEIHNGPAMDSVLALVDDSLLDVSMFSRHSREHEKHENVELLHYLSSTLPPISKQEMHISTV
jgi:hypothetical protein